MLIVCMFLVCHLEMWELDSESLYFEGSSYPPNKIKLKIPSTGILWRVEFCCDDRARLLHKVLVVSRVVLSVGYFVALLMCMRLLAPVDYVCVYTSRSFSISLSLYIYIYTHICAYTYIHAYLLTCIHICIYIYIYTYVYIYIYTYTSAHVYGGTDAVSAGRTGGSLVSGNETATWPGLAIYIV